VPAIPCGRVSVDVFPYLLPMLTTHYNSIDKLLTTIKRQGQIFGFVLLLSF